MLASIANTFSNCFKIPELKSRILFTIMLLAVCRLTAFIVIPGIAFDMTGKRIGYGKGYYDRTLHHLEGEGKLVGFCYDFQLVDAIAGEPHDVLMDLLITDKRVIRPRD